MAGFNKSPCRFHQITQSKKVFKRIDREFCFRKECQDIQLHLTKNVILVSSETFKHNYQAVPSNFYFQFF